MPTYPLKVMLAISAISEPVGPHGSLLVAKRVNSVLQQDA